MHVHVFEQLSTGSRAEIAPYRRAQLMHAPDRRRESSREVWRTASAVGTMPLEAMTATTSSPTFHVRCRDCGQTVLWQIERVTEAEERELRRHLVACRPDLTTTTAEDHGLGPLLARFEVATTRNGG